MINNKTDLFLRSSLVVPLGCTNKAFMVERIAWSERSKLRRSDYTPINGRHYMWQTYDQWVELLFWLNIRTVQRHLADLREREWIYGVHLGKAGDRTLHYAVNLALYYEHCPDPIYGDMTECRDDMTESHKDTTPSPTRHHTESNSAPCLNLSSLSNNLSNNQTHNRCALKLHKDCIPFDEEIAAQWLDHAKSIVPGGTYNRIGFANAIMKMRTKFKMKPQDIRFMLDWIKANKFWKSKAISPVSLFKPSPSQPDITKLEQVFIAIEGRKKTKSERVMESILRTESEDLLGDCPF